MTGGHAYVGWVDEGGQGRVRGYTMSGVEAKGTRACPPPARGAALRAQQHCACCGFWVGVGFCQVFLAVSWNHFMLAFILPPHSPRLLKPL